MTTAVGPRIATPRGPIRPEAADLDAAFHSIVEGTAGVTGDAFFGSLVRHLAAALGVRHALVAEVVGPRRVRLLSFWRDHDHEEPFAYDLAGHPCGEVYDDGFCHYASGLRQAYPHDEGLRALGAEGYLGILLKDGNGQPVGHLAVLDDRPLPAALRRTSILRIFAARAAAELTRLHAVQERDALVNMLVHDLRNPLTALSGHLELAEEEDRPAQAVQRSVASARSSAQRLLDMVGEILDVAKMEAGRMPLEHAVLALDAVVADVAQEIQPLMARKRLILDTTAVARASVLGDASAVRRVLHNLLANAIGFSPGNGVVQIAAAPVSGGVRVAVTDQGPGVPEADRARVFDKFTPAARRAGRRHSTGLGLAFCKLAVEAMGGAIGVEDGPAGGSAFFFTLPAPVPVAAN